MSLGNKTEVCSPVFQLKPDSTTPPSIILELVGNELVSRSLGINTSPSAGEVIRAIPDIELEDRLVQSKERKT